MGAQATVGAMLADVVGDLAARLESRTPAAVADEPDAVHQLRTAVRRLRNVFAAFAAYVEPAAAGGLRAGLADYGDRLGRARDLEVRAAWCAEVAVEVGVPAAVREGLVDPIRKAHALAHADLVVWIGSAGAGALTGALRAWAAEPSLVDGSGRPAAVTAREVLDAQVARVLAHGDDYRSDEEAAHSLRKACRRLRHTADALTRPPAAVLGEDVVTLGELASRVQARLGDHRDALLLADYVAGSRPHDASARASYAAVVEAAERAAAGSLAAVPQALADLETAVRVP